MGKLKDFLWALKRNNITGKIGEIKVNNKLNPWLFERSEHLLINNLILVDEKNNSHQIDHVEIRKNGIFCIETKNYKGSIFGNENQKCWTQVLYNGEKHQFLNPLKQNKSHIYYINQILGNDYKVNSVVVLVQNNADKIDCSNVVNLNDLILYLNNFDDGIRLSTEDMNIVYNRLKNANVKMSGREHFEKISQVKNNIELGICPRCGGKLIERLGKYGKFKGCANYPKCKFVLNEGL